MAGSSPAKGIFDCLRIVVDNQFLSTRQPWVEPSHDDATTVITGLDPVICDCFGARLRDAHGSSPWAEGPRVETGHDAATTVITGLDPVICDGLGAASNPRN